MSPHKTWLAPEPIQRLGWGGGKRLWIQTENELGELSLDDPRQTPIWKVFLRERGAVEFLGYWPSGKFAYFTPGGEVSVMQPSGEKVHHQRLGEEWELVESYSFGDRIGLLTVWRQGDELGVGIPQYEWVMVGEDLKQVVRIPLSQSIAPHTLGLDLRRGVMWAGLRIDDEEWRQFDLATGKELERIRWKVFPHRKEWVVGAAVALEDDRVATLVQSPTLGDFRLGLTQQLGQWPQNWQRIGDSQGEFLSMAWHGSGEVLAVQWQYPDVSRWEWFRFQEGQWGGRIARGTSESRVKGFWMQDYWVFLGDENEICFEEFRL